jgi:hypothetical protein
MRRCLVTPLRRCGREPREEYGTECLRLAVDGDYIWYDAPDIDDQIAGYDVVVFDTSSSVYHKILEIIKKHASKVFVAWLACDDSFHYHSGFVDASRGLAFRAIADSVDLVITETRRCEFFRAMSRTPVGSLAIPVPVDIITEYAFDPSERVKPPLVYLKSSIERPCNNGLSTALAFKRLREIMGGNVHGLVFCENPDRAVTDYTSWGIEAVQARPFEPHPGLWSSLASCSLGLSMDYRVALGRFSGESAALGIPTVGNSNLTMQRELFPDLCVDPWDIDSAAQLGARLLLDPTYRDRVCQEAALALARYRPAVVAEQFTRLLRAVKRK